MLYGYIIGIYIVSAIICYFGMRKILNDIDKDANAQDVICVLLPCYNTFVACILVYVFITYEDKWCNKFFFMKK